MPGGAGHLGDGAGRHLVLGNIYVDITYLMLRWIRYLENIQFENIQFEYRFVVKVHAFLS